MTETAFPLTEHADRTVIAASGDVDRSTAADLETALRTAAERGLRCDIDLSDVDFMDSSGLRSLVSGFQKFDEQSLSLRVTNPQPAVRRVLEITDLAERFGLT